MVYKLTFRTLVAPCSVNGIEFQVVDLDGGKDSTKQYKTWNNAGYPGTASIGAFVPTDERAFINGEDFGLLVGKRVAFVLYDLIDRTVDRGPGKAPRRGALRPHLGFRHRRRRLAVNDTEPGDTRSISLRFVGQVTSTVCCVAQPATRTVSLSICDVDGTMADSCRAERKTS